MKMMITTLTDHGDGEVHVLWCMPAFNDEGEKMRVVSIRHVRSLILLKCKITSSFLCFQAELMKYFVISRTDNVYICFHSPDWSSNQSQHVLIRQESGIAAGNGINITILVEGNTTTSLSLGHYAFGDVDASDNVTHINMSHDVVNATFSVTDVSWQNASEVVEGLNLQALTSGLGVRALTLSLDKGYGGKILYEVRILYVSCYEDKVYGGNENSVCLIG
jgi:hypothetical protein